MKRFAVIILFVFSIVHVHAQDVPGCTDPKANNYNPRANIQDGTCTYGITIYNPPFKYRFPDEVNETSGLLYFGGRIWTINDSGNDPILFGLDPVSGTIVQRVRIENAINRDWEDLAQDDSCVYIGDFGNNSGGRQYLDIYRILKSAIPDRGDVEVKSEKIVFEYPDYRGKAEKKKTTNFDCEAFVVVGDSIHLFSKNWGNQKTRHYRIPKVPGHYMAEKMFTFDSRGLITAADYNPQTHELVLLGYTKNEWVPFMWLLFDFQDNDFFSGNKRRIDMLNIIATQTEGICFVEGSSGIITSEGSRAFSQTAYDFSTSRWIGSNKATADVSAPTNLDFTLSPNPLLKSKLDVVFKDKPTGLYELELYDATGAQIHLKKYKMKRKDGKVKIKLRLGFLLKGEYFIRIGSGSTFVEHQFTKE
jgi:hypothetical protein